MKNVHDYLDPKDTKNTFRTDLIKQQKLNCR